MFPLPLSSVLIAAFLYTSYACASIILSNQCWQETALHSVTLQSHQSRTENDTVEVVHPITNTLPSIPFHLPWPWTNPPSCTAFIPDIQSKLCVYTSNTFTSGRGITIVTTPVLAAHIVSLPAFTTPALKITHANEFSETWFTSSIPSKGTGTIALQDLSPGVRTHHYTPAFIAFLESSLSTLAREALWSLAISRLPPRTRDTFLSLSTIYNDPRVRVQDITKANTFQLLISGTNHLAIFPETSRLNHDCAPNAQYVLDPLLLTHTVHTTRPVPEGEELTIAYTTPLDSTAARREKLDRGFHFTCACARCKDTARSDAALTRIHALQRTLNDWSPGSLATPELATQLHDLYVSEGLEGFLDVPYGFLALAENAVGRVGKAEEWARKAREAVLKKDGMGAEAMGVWDALLKDARAHWSFRRRM